MPFAPSEQHRVEFFSVGVAVFRGILPPALLADLRGATAEVARLAREKSGPQAQRLQPIGAYDLPAKPFREYAELPALRDAVTAVLSPAHEYGRPDTLGLLIEPGEQPWCTNWHRDFRDHVTPEVFEREFRADLTNQGSRRSPEEQERLCLSYCEGMPNAVQLHLNAGDFALYRPSAWHLGNYVPYRKRMTLHDAVLTPAAHVEWSRTTERWNRIRAQAKG